ncbi:MAG: sigma-54-dependent Fis family transcriptional regulator [Deltaproteobacteria bacterium]|nr:sigma-54-dependent Fis family transcriptional regulator [Deltaproteobacteria bacterium]
MVKILVIDDEEYIRDILSTRVERMGHVAYTASTIEHGLKRLEQTAFGLVFLDVNLPDGNGLTALPAIKANRHQPQVIIITAVGSVRGAELAIKNGAWDYIEKPFKKEDIILHVQRALEFRDAKQHQPQRVLLDTDTIIGKSNAINKCLQQVAQCASGSVNVLIQGETGTGKELFAKAIHDNCMATNDTYIVVDCAAMPEALTESVLFGHKKGAFTGADKDSKGLIEKADGGTLFLDEIGELPLPTQKAFLRVLQEKKFRPVGSTKEIKSSFRLISATNRNLDIMVEQGEFRNDLLHRLKTFVIELPPLRDRKEDIKDISLFYLDQLCKKHETPQKVLLPDTLSILEAYDWPGNVRELINAIEKAILSEPDMPLLYSMLLPAHIRVSHAEKGLKYLNTNSTGTALPSLASLLCLTTFNDQIPPFKVFRNNTLEQVEPLYFQTLMVQAGWNLDQAAKISGLSKNRLYFFIRKYHLKKD